jgi:putative phosphoribosyl transferase
MLNHPVSPLKISSCLNVRLLCKAAHYFQSFFRWISCTMNPQTYFRNRTEAGHRLGQALQAYAQRTDVIVLGLPRGGVPVAFEVAQVLHAPLDVCIVRKLGVPGHSELAMGAIAAGGIRVLNEEVIQQCQISEIDLQVVTERESQELQRREQVYRDDRPPLNVHDRTVILVDDGLATGSTMRAAIAVLKVQQPKAIVVAVPVAPVEVCREFAAEVDQIICLAMPDPFSAIGQWYEDFSQNTDAEVCHLLACQTISTPF